MNAHAVIEQAKRWLGTPYHHRARIRGVGVDCAMLLLEVYRDAGVIPHVDLEDYPHDWHMHRSEERYLNKLLEYCEEVDAPVPGGVALFKFGRCFSHGAIVVDWPTVIHSFVRIGVEQTQADQGRLAGHDVRFFKIK